MNYFIHKSKNINILILLNFLFGIGYIIIEWLKTNKIDDSIFIGLLLSATMFLIYNISGVYKDIAQNSIEFYIFLYQGSELEDVKQIYNNDVKDIFNGLKALVFSLVFCSLFGIVIWNLSNWKSDIIINIIFTLFIVVANFITGLAMFSLIRFYKVCYRWLKDLKLNIWMIDNKATKYIRRIRNKILLIMSIYISASLSSILFSSIKIGSTVLFYALLALILLISAYLLPEITLKNKIITLRNEMVDDLNSRISLEYQVALQISQDKESVIDLSKFNSFIQVKEKVISYSVGNLDLGRVISFFTLVLVTGIPVFLQWILEKIV